MAADACQFFPGLGDQVFVTHHATRIPVLLGELVKLVQALMKVDGVLFGKPEVLAAHLGHGGGDGQRVAPKHDEFGIRKGLDDLIRNQRVARGFVDKPRLVAGKAGVDVEHHAPHALAVGLIITGPVLAHVFDGDMNQALVVNRTACGEISFPQ